MFTFKQKRKICKVQIMYPNSIFQVFLYFLESRDGIKYCFQVSKNQSHTGFSTDSGVWNLYKCQRVEIAALSAYDVCSLFGSVPCIKISIQACIYYITPDMVIVWCINIHLSLDNSMSTNLDCFINSDGKFYFRKHFMFIILCKS